MWGTDVKRRIYGLVFLGRILLTLKIRVFSTLAVSRSDSRETASERELTLRQSLGGFHDPQELAAMPLLVGSRGGACPAARVASRLNVLNANCKARCASGTEARCVQGDFIPGKCRRRLAVRACGLARSALFL